MFWGPQWLQSEPESTSTTSSSLRIDLAIHVGGSEIGCSAAAVGRLFSSPLPFVPVVIEFGRLHLPIVSEKPYRSGLI